MPFGSCAKGGVLFSAGSHGCQRLQFQTISWHACQTRTCRFSRTSRHSENRCTYGYHSRRSGSSSGRLHLNMLLKLRRSFDQHDRPGMGFCRHAGLRNEGFSCQVLTEWIPKTHQERLCCEDPKADAEAETREGATGAHSPKVSGTCVKGSFRTTM